MAIRKGSSVMRSEQKSDVQNSLGRVVLVGLAVLAQIAWIIVLFVRLNRYSAGISLITSIIAFVLVIFVFNLRINSALKMPWIIIIAAFPVLGVVMYLLLEGSRYVSRDRRQLALVDSHISSNAKQDAPMDANVFASLEADNTYAANQARYLRDVCGFPVYNDTNVDFFSEASDGLEAQLKDLAQAKSFIFMEYHAIEDSTSFGRIHDILVDRVHAGVDVRVFYDDMGSFGFINRTFIKKMQADGIACRVFNPMVPFLKVFMDNRDHRKITVIDGRVGYTGGYNLADEYFGLTHPYGHWKDTGVRLEGKAVISLTAAFLEMWHVMDNREMHKAINISEDDIIQADFDKSFSDLSAMPSANNAQGVSDYDLGFVVPYADNPYGSERIGENVYLNAIKSATRYVWISTPYLIITDEMNRELTLAAKRGVDVRILCPGIPDKKMIYRITRSYYDNLVRGGVHIYEYSPGFNHAKQILVDDEIATVGTINFDFRSLYHHFENGVWFYRCPMLADIKRDFETMFSMSEDVTPAYCQRKGSLHDLWTSVLRLGSPLL